MKLRATALLLVLVLASVALLVFGVSGRDTERRDERAVLEADAVPVATTGSSADVILRAAAATVHPGWSVVSDSSAAGGSRLANPNAGAPKVTAPLASPAAYFDLTFTADAGTAYRLWIRGKAQNNSYDNDSVYVQFSDSVTSAGAAAWRTGSTSATSVVLEDCSGCGVSGWGWQDNGYGTGVLGTPVYFASTGTHTVRIQVREDGLSIDQVVLSPVTYFTTAPGATKNDTTILVGGDTTGTPPPSSSSGDQILLATAATTHPGGGGVSSATRPPLAEHASPTPTPVPPRSVRRSPRRRRTST
jgi:hypothetical protein